MVCILICFCCIFYFDFFDFFRDVYGLNMFCFACLMIDRARAGLKTVVNDEGEAVFRRIENEIGVERGANGVHFDFFFCCIFHFDFFDFFRDVCRLNMFCFVCLMIDRARAGLKIVGNDGAEGVFG